MTTVLENDENFAMTSQAVQKFVQNFILIVNHKMPNLSYLRQKTSKDVIGQKVLRFWKVTP